MLTGLGEAKTCVGLAGSSSGGGHGLVGPPLDAPVHNAHMGADTSTHIYLYAHLYAHATDSVCTSSGTSTL